MAGASSTGPGSSSEALVPLRPMDPALAKMCADGAHEDSRTCNLVRESVWPDFLQNIGQGPFLAPGKPQLPALAPRGGRAGGKRAQEAKGAKGGATGWQAAGSQGKGNINIEFLMPG